MHENRTSLHPITTRLPQPRLERVVSHGIAFHTDEALLGAVGVRIAFTERQGGVSTGAFEGLDLAAHVGDDPVAVEENRASLLSALDIPVSPDRIVNPSQVHGDFVFTVREAADDTSRVREGCDAVCCLAPGVPVLLCYADCVPIVLVAPDGSFCVAHSGWRGSLAGIAGKACGVLCEESGCAPDTVNAYIGAHIRSCCYGVSSEIMESFVERFGDGVDAGEGHLSLSAAVRCSLAEAGVTGERVAELSVCTAESGRFYSYRASGGTCGRHGALACRM